MKAVLINGSPHEHGFTRMLAAEYLASLGDGWSVQQFDAYSIDARPCLGCGACSAENICPQDDLEMLIEAIYECDLLIIASPVYYLTFPAPLKAIIDRLQRFHEADRRGDNRMREKERRCAVLLTAGAPSEKGEVISQQLRWITGSLGISDAEMIVCADTDRMDPVSFPGKAREALRLNNLPRG